MLWNFVMLRNCILFHSPNPRRVCSFSLLRGVEQQREAAKWEFVVEDAA